MVCCGLAPCSIAKGNTLLEPHIDIRLNLHLVVEIIFKFLFHQIFIMRMEKLTYLQNKMFS